MTTNDQISQILEQQAELQMSIVAVVDHLKALHKKIQRLQDSVDDVRSIVSDKQVAQ